MKKEQKNLTNKHFYSRRRKGLSYIVLKMKNFKNTRLKVGGSLPQKSLLILGSAPEVLRQPDVLHPYRQDSNFYYVTGFLQPSSLFILLSGKTLKSILFIADKDPKKELWDGIRYTTAEVKKKYLLDEVYYLKDLDKKLPLYLKNKNTIFYNKVNPPFDKKLKPYQKKISSAQEFLSPFREIKNQSEIASIKKACSVTAYAHKEIALNLKPNVNERALHGIFLKSIMEKGSAREGYGGIIACGNNAVTLHYIQNNSPCKSGEVLLVDAGAEMDYYTADVTRVYPVNGKFLKNQKQLYNKLLKLQKQLIQQVKPGISMQTLNEKMVEGIASILIEMKFLQGTAKEAIKKKSVFKYCPHSVGHLLGLDVHDPWFKDRKDLILKAGMVITIEPGIYISKKDTSAAKDLRGLGFRIEDNVLVTPSGQEVLTKNIPKELKEIEKICSLKKH